MKEKGSEQIAKRINQRIISVILFLVISCILVQAQSVDTLNVKHPKKERKIGLWGHVKNSFTKVGIPNVKITLMNTDSTVVDTMTVNSGTNWNSSKLDAYYKFEVPAVPHKYIILARHPDYYDTYVDYEIKHIARNMYFDAPWHFMKRKNIRDENVMLKEVVVKATKVKMVYKGDTLVYNADAFNLPQGSMLDDLIKQLPGAQLKDNGEIYINGRKVDYLTLNGKEFFKGNNKAMLENMPYYTVKNLQVYDKRTEKSEYLGYNAEKKDYVMDVTLKREYSKGYIANVEASKGTSDRYLARGFGLRFTDNSRISIFSNLNNINEYRKPGSDGDWTPSNSPQGTCDTKKIGMDLLIDDKDKRYTEKANSQISWQDNDYQQRNASEVFLTTGNTYTYGESSSRSKYLSFNMTNDFTLKKPIWIRSMTYLSYSHTRSNQWNRNVTFGSNPDYSGGTQEVLDSIYKAMINPTLKSIAVNRNRSISKDNSDYIYGSEYFDISKKLPWGDDLDLSCDLLYQKNKTKNYEQYSLDYLKTDETSDFRNKYSAYSFSMYRYSPKIEYTIHTLTKWNFLFYGMYTQQHESKVNDLYRLDRLDGWGVESERTLGDLPSTRDSLLLGLDASNTYNSTYLARTTQGGFRVFLDKETKDGYIWFNLHLPLKRYIERTHYVKNKIDTCFYLRNWVFKPDMTLQIYTHKYNRMYYFNYYTDFGTPFVYDMINTTDDSNPLAVRIGNPNLKNWVTYNFNFRYTDKQPETQQNFGIGGTVNIYTNKVGNGFTYDAVKGRYIYHPQNVNGNWHCSLAGTFGRAIDNQKFWTWETRFSWNYNHSVDFASVSGKNESELSEVNNHELEDVLRLRYQRDKLTLGVQCDLTWRNSSSHRDGFTTINAFDYNYGITGEYTFPWKLQFATDFKMYSRRGYDDSSMNTNNLIWNASLSRAFCKSRLIAKITGYDLFHQMSQVTYYVNGQGKTETWINTIPSYVMMSISYKINVQPKNK